MGDPSFLSQNSKLPQLLSSPGHPAMTHDIRVSAAATSDYPELTTPYSAVSSFNFPASADSALLTPVSGSGSPPLQLNHKFPGSRYSTPSAAPHHQEGTPPSQPKMYQWPPTFSMDGHSAHSTSSMPNPSAVAEASDFLSSATYLTDDRRPTPGPPEHAYTGVYGVSQSPEHGLHQSGTSYYMNVGPMSTVDGMICREETPMPMETDRPMDRQQMPGGHLLGQQPNPGSSQDGAVVTNGSRRRVATSRVRKTKTTGRKSQSVASPFAEEPSDEHKNCLGMEDPPRLKENCPAEERLILESRWRHRHQKGHDMWLNIQADFENKFHKQPGKEALQMKFARARSKYYDWLPEDENILRKAFIEIEKDRYKLLLQKFLELGGSRNMQLNDGDIEIKVANDLKLEEGFYMENYQDVGVRRRRKVNRKKGAGRGDGSSIMQDDMTIIGSHHPTNEDEIMRQVGSRHGWNTNQDLGSDMMNMQMQVKMEPGLLPEHVARQHHANRMQGQHYARGAK